MAGTQKKAKPRPRRRVRTGISWPAELATPLALTEPRQKGVDAFLAVQRYFGMSPKAPEDLNKNDWRALALHLIVLVPAFSRARPVRSGRPNETEAADRCGFFERVNWEISRLRGQPKAIDTVCDALANTEEGQRKIAPSLRGKSAARLRRIYYSAAKENFGLEVFLEAVRQSRAY